MIKNALIKTKNIEMTNKEIENIINKTDCVVINKDNYVDNGIISIKHNDIIINDYDISRDKFDIIITATRREDGGDSFILFTGCVFRYSDDNYLTITFENFYRIYSYVKEEI